jgi:hypothetical protein
MALIMASNAGAQNLTNAPTGGVRPAVAGAALSANQGHFICTAAITATGAVFSGQYVLSAAHLSTGTYQVLFDTASPSPCPNVTIATGWFRVCQPDTLTAGTLPARSCTVADRSGSPNGVFVQTFSNSGALVDTPFTLQLSR